MRPILRALRNAWLDWRTLRWLLRLRFELRRNGGRLKVEGWRGIRMAQRPRIRALPLGDGDGVTRIRLSPEVMIGYGVIIELHARGDNLLEVKRGAHVYEGARLDLKGGTIRIGDGTMVHGNVVLKSDGDLRLGERVRVSHGTCIHCSAKIEVGHDTGLGEYVSIVDSDHTADGSDKLILAQPIMTDPVLVETNVLVGRGAVILRGTRIGTNSVVAANSVVTAGEYPSGSLFAGAPAKLVRELGPGA